MRRTKFQHRNYEKLVGNCGYRGASSVVHEVLMVWHQRFSLFLVFFPVRIGGPDNTRNYYLALQKTGVVLLVVYVSLLYR